MKNWTIPLGIAAVVLIGAALYFNLPEAETEDHSELPEGWLMLTPEQVVQGEFQFTSVQEGKISDVLPVFGRIALCPENHAHISTRTAAVAKHAYKNLGDRVQAGETLAVLESRELAEAKAAYLNAASSLALQKKLLENEEHLAEKNLSAEQELHLAKNAHTQAKIERDLAEQKLYLFGLEGHEIENLADQHSGNFRLFEVKAPFDGTILKRDLTIGESIGEGTEIYEIADLERVWIDFAVSPRDLARLRLNQEIALEDRLGNKAKVAVERISPIIDEMSGMVRVIASLPNPELRWRPGASIFGKLLVDTHDVRCSVPIDALVEIEDKPHVFVVHGDQFEARLVVVGLRDEERASILSGLEPDELIVSKNATLLKCELTKQEPD